MPIVKTPSSLPAVASESTEGVYVLPFGMVFDRAILSPSTLNFEVEIDTAQTFATVNAIKLSNNSSDSRLSGFQNGQVGKGFEVLLPKRSSEDVTWYWRVRINSGAFQSGWSQIQNFMVPAIQSISRTNEIFARLADENSYDKDSNSSNVYKKLLQFGRELDLLQLEKERTISDLFIDTARDTALTNNFSRYLELSRVATEQASHHRWKTHRLWKTFINYPGTEQGMLDAVKAFVAEEPTILDLTATEGWILGQNIVKVPSRPDLQPIIILYGRPQKGHSFILNVFNSWNLEYDQTVLENYIAKQKPAHAEITINYPTSRNWSLRYDRQEDWLLWANSGNIDLSVNPGTVRLDGVATSGTLTSPPTKVLGVNGFDTPLFLQWPAGGTVLIEARTSADGASWTPWIELEHGTEPGSNLTIQDWFQFRVVLSRSAGSDPNPVVGSVEYRGTRT